MDVTYYKSLIRSLRYLTTTRLNIVFGVGLLNRFMEKPYDCYLQSTKRILHYIKSTLSDGIFYVSVNDVKLVGYIGSDWVGDIETRKSISGYVFHLDPGIISWSLKKQLMVALSTIVAKYMAIGCYATQAVWLRRILEELHQK